MATPSRKLRSLLESDEFLVMPCCFDAFSARLIEMAGFPLTFMSGFGVAATRLGFPDTGLISYSEMLDQGRGICESVSIPVIGDADTGYGNPLNVKRTIQGYAKAGFACAMIEDQLAPKRCGHTQGKQVVSREDALNRIRAAVDARDEGAEILIMARTDAAATLGIDEAIARGQAFAELGVDIVFVEAPATEDEMRRIPSEIPAITMVNMIKGGRTPVLPPEQLSALGFRIAAYPLSLISAAAKSMQDALAALSRGEMPEEAIDFETLRSIAGFPAYDAALKRYS